MSRKSPLIIRVAILFALVFGDLLLFNHQWLFPVQNAYASAPEAPVASNGLASPLALSYNIDGYHDGVSGNQPINQCFAGGWAKDTTDPSYRVSIRVMTDYGHAGSYTTQLGSGTANGYRSDLTGICTGGNCGYMVGFPTTMPAYNTNVNIQVQALAKNSSNWVTLNNSPKTLNCMDTSTPAAPVYDGNSVGFANGGIFTGAGVWFYWHAPQADTSVDYYNVYFGTDPNGTNGTAVFTTYPSTNASWWANSNSSYGPWYFRARTHARNGNYSAWTTLIYYYWDTTNPTVNGVTGGTLGSWTTSSQTYYASCYDIVGISQAYVSSNSSSFSVNPYTVNFSTNGLPIYVKCVDNAGFSTVSQVGSAYVDLDDPVAPTSANPNNAGGCAATSGTWQDNCNRPVFTWSGASDATSGVYGYYYYWGPLSNGSPSTWTNTAGFSSATLSDGINYLRVQTVDYAGRKSLINTLFALAYDSTSPTNTSGLTAWPAGTSSGNWTNVTAKPSFTFSPGSDSLSGIYGYNIYWGTDVAGTTGTFQTGTTFTAPSNIASGSTYYLRVQAKDNAGNPVTSTAGWANLFTYKYDTSAPTAPSVSASPSGWTNASSVILSASGSSDTTGISYYQFGDGAASWQTGSSVSVTATGTTCYFFRAVDTAGNISSNSSQVCAKIDRANPTATVSLSPSTWTNGTVVATINPFDSGGSLFKDARCKVGSGGTWSLYAAAPTCSTDANATIYWEARDNASNTGSGSSDVTNIDTAAPGVPSVSASPVGWTNTSTVTLSASGSGDSGGSLLKGYQYSSTGDSGWVDGSSIDVSTTGSTCYFFRALDNAGNVSSNSSQICARIDQTNPTATVVLSTSAWTNGTVSATINASDDGGALYKDARCKVGPAGVWSSYATSPICTLSTNGTVYWEARDNVGNTGSGVYDVTNIETQPSSIPTVSAFPAGWTNSTPVVLSASGATDSGGSGLKGYQYSRDGVSDWTDGDFININVSGTTCYYFRSIDNAGNVSSNSSQVCAQVDNDAPTATVSLNPSGWTSGSVIATVIGSDLNGSGFKDARCKTGASGVWSDYAATPTCSLSANDTIYWEARDNVGNNGTGSQSVTNIDTSAPTTPIVSATPAEWTKSSVTLSATGSSDVSGISKYQYSLDGSTNWTDGSSVLVSTQGPVCYFFRAIDGVGNISSNSGQICAQVDLTTPSTVMSVTETHGIASGTQQNSTELPSFTWSPATDIAGIRGYNVYFGTNPSGTSTSEINTTAYTPAAPADGVELFYLRIRSIDTAGNTSAWRMVYIFNYVAPTAVPLTSAVETHGLADNTWQNAIDKPAFTWTSPDTYVNQYSLYFGPDPSGIGSGFSGNLSFAPAAVQNNGKYYLRVQTKNQANKLSPWTTVYTFDFDNVSPNGVDYPITDNGGSRNNICQSNSRRPEFTWNKPTDNASGVVGYNYYWSKDPNDVVPEGVKSISGESLVFEQDVDGGIYFLQMQSKDAAGNLSDWSIAYVYCYALDNTVTSSTQSTQLQAVLPASNNAQLEVTLPPQMAPDNLQVVVYPPANESPAPASLDKVGTSFALEAVSTSTNQKIEQFDKPYAITIHYTSADVANIDESTLKIYYHNPTTDQWEVLPDSVVDFGLKTVTATVSHMSEFSIMGVSVSGASNSTIVLTSGALSVNSQHIEFGSITLTGHPLSLKGTTEAWLVVDASGTGAGWHLTMSATDFVSDKGTTIPSQLFKVKLNDAQIQKMSGKGLPTAVLTSSTSLTSDAQTILSAPAGDGMGAFQFTPVFDLTILPSVYAGNYNSTVTVTAISGP